MLRAANSRETPLSDDRLTTFDRARQLCGPDLARRWAELPPATARNGADYPLEGPGLSELEALALTAALAAAASASLGEMIHRAALIGADLYQLAAAANAYPESLWGVWDVWAGQERGNGVMPHEEYAFVSDRLSNRVRGEHFLLQHHSQAPEQG